MYTHPLYHWPPKVRWIQKPSSGHRWSAFSSYIHFPFCRNICDFCGYETRLISEVSAGDFPKHAIDEIRNHAHSSDLAVAPLRAVFFGGGTASLMSDRGIAEILSTLQECSIGTVSPEVTLECEPGTISRLKLKSVQGFGVTRVSVCGQSLSDSQLHAIGRKHTNEQSMRLIDDCHEAGIHNVHLDLMYGLPGQTEKDWEHTLVKASLLPVSHISTYKLFVFKHGLLDRENSVPRAKCEPESLTQRMRTMHEASREILGAAGFKQYTLTEFSRPGYDSEYIKSCFDGGDLLPIGPSAFGRCGTEVWENSPFVHLYGRAEREVQHTRALRLTAIEAFKRDIILGLWLLSVSTDELAARHGVTIGQDLLDLFRQLSSEDLIEFSGHKVSLAERHRFAAGEAMARLARMDAGQWGIAEVNRRRENSADSSEDSAASDRALKFSTIFRTARRDRQFFDALRRNPLATLHSLGYSLCDPDVIDLSNAINGYKGNVNNAGEDVLRNTWAAVQREHVWES